MRARLVVAVRFKLALRCRALAFVVCQRGWDRCSGESAAATHSCELVQPNYKIKTVDFDLKKGACYHGNKPSRFVCFDSFIGPLLRPSTDPPSTSRLRVRDN